MSAERITENAITRSLLDDVLEIIGDYTGSVRTYSGRAMYGAECAAVVLEEATPALFIFGLTIALEELAYDIDEINDTWRALAKHYAQTMHTDTMGRSTILYWPRIKLIEDEV